MKSGRAKKAEHPSVRVAERFLETALRSRQFADGDRLPPLRALARKARVSPASMLKALHALQAQGLVTIVKNHGTFAGKPEDRIRPLDAENLDKPPKEKWRRLRMLLEQDVYGGRFAKGADLPSLRDLAPKYGTSPPTLRKAMQALIRAGVLELHGRGIRVPRPAAQPGQASVLFTAWVPPEEELLWFRRDRNVELLASLDKACAEANLRLLAGSYHPRYGVRMRVGSASDLAKMPIRAHLAWVPTLSERDFHRFRADLSALHVSSQHPRPRPTLAGSRKVPFAVFDGARGTSMTLPGAREYPATRIFSIARKRAGEQIGRFLLGLGHRRIAYLSACHAEPWSRDRLFGLKQACDSTGFPEVLRAFTLPVRDDTADKPEAPSHILAAETALAASLTALESGLGRDSQAWMAMQLRTSLELFKAGSRTGYSLFELIDRMRAWGATACVAANDAMAVTALHRLRRGGVRVPEDMALIGFDDDKFAADNNLTSYNFNRVGIAGAMLRYVLDPEKALPADRDGVFECRGVLIERDSTRVG